VQAQLEQLALNAWCTPARVVAAHHPDQIPNPLRHAGPTWLAAADSPRPEPAKAFTMPGDNCVSLDDHQDGFPVAPRVVAARQGFPVVAGPKSFSTGAGPGEQALLRRPTEQNESRSTSMVAGRSEYFGEAIWSDKNMARHATRSIGCLADIGTIFYNFEYATPRSADPAAYAYRFQLPGSAGLFAPFAVARYRSADMNRPRNTGVLSVFWRNRSRPVGHRRFFVRLLASPAQC
jgi:hypothetical protein